MGRYKTEMQVRLQEEERKRLIKLREEEKKRKEEERKQWEERNPTLKLEREREKKALRELEQALERRLANPKSICPGYTSERMQDYRLSKLKGFLRDIHQMREMMADNGYTARAASPVIEEPREERRELQLLEGRIAKLEGALEQAKKETPTPTGQELTTLSNEPTCGTCEVLGKPIERAPSTDDADLESWEDVGTSREQVEMEGASHC